MHKDDTVLPRFGFDWPYLRAAWREMLTPATLARDCMAGVVVAVIALPLCIAFAVASGVAPGVGIVTGVLGGLIAGLFGGSRFSVSGPAAAMAILLCGITERFGVAGLLCAGFVCGGLQLCLGLFRLGRFVQYIPVPVVSGFTSGIGVLIILMQIPGLLGLPKPAGHLPLDYYLTHLSDLQWADATVALVTVAALLAVRRGSRVPGALVAVIAGTVVSLVIPRLVPGSDVARVGDIPRMLPTPQLWDVPWDRLGELLVPCLAVFGLATIESLLCAVSCDGQSGTRHHSNQELIGQGLANLVIPFFGGIPVTGVIVRSSAGIRAGAQTRLAAISHAVILLLLMVALADVAALIPRAALAGILLVTGYRMFEYDMLVRTVKASRAEGLVLAGTLVTTVLSDLIVGVAVGVGLAVVVFAGRMARQVSVRRWPEARPQTGHVVVHRVTGPLFFGSTPAFTGALEDVGDRGVLILDLNDATGLDTTACEAILHLEARLRRRGTTVLLSGIGPHRKLLRRFGTLEVIGPENTFLQLSAALARAHGLAGEALPSVARRQRAA